MMNIVEEAVAKLSGEPGLDAAHVKDALEGFASSEALLWENRYATFTLLPLFLKEFTAKETLHLFESKKPPELFELGQRLNQTEYLAHPSQPLYTLVELVELIGGFIEHLHRNREGLLRTGYPDESTSRSLWLEWHLGRLYHVRTAPTENAPILDGLQQQDALDLESGRAKFLDIKVRILKRLVGALRAGVDADLWPDCLAALTETLSAQEAEFYLRMDRFYHGSFLGDTETCDVRGSALLCFLRVGADVQSRWLPGGLSGILAVVGHCENELASRTMHSTKAALSSLPVPWPFSYCAAISHPWRSDVDMALDRFLELEKGEGDFWRSFLDRVNNSLQNEFYEEVVTRTRVKRPVAARFEKNVQSYAQWAKTLLETTDSLPQLHVSYLPEPQVKGNVFRREGEYWTLTYAGKTIRLKDAVGLRHIAFLMQTPDRMFPVFDLVVVARRQAPTIAGDLHSKMSKDQLQDEGLGRSDLGDAGELLDNKAISEYKRRLRVLERDLEEAETNNDLGRKSQVSTELETIKQQLSSAVGLHGRPRRSAQSIERVRKAVTNAISDSLSKIQSEHEDLWRHLRNAVKTGTTCSYSPEKSPDWKF